METLTPRTWRRRTVVGSATAAAALVLFASVAWACTQRVGTLQVCAGSGVYVYGPGCAKITGTSQGGAVTPRTVGDAFSVKAKNFKTKPYSVTYRDPNFPSNDCHRPTLSNPGTHLLTATAGGTQFMGPIFKKTFILPAAAGTGSGTGPAKICAEDVPDVVTGQVIDFTVI